MDTSSNVLGSAPFTGWLNHYNQIPEDKRKRIAVAIRLGGFEAACRAFSLVDVMAVCYGFPGLAEYLPLHAWL